MMKIDEFSATNCDPKTRCKIAAQVTGLQKPANITQDAREIWVLNEKVQFDKGGVQCHDSPYVWLGRSVWLVYNRPIQGRLLGC